MQHEKDIQLIKDYIAANNLSVIEESQANYFYDLYFESGDSIAPIKDKALWVYIKYKTYLLDGTLVDSSSSTGDLVFLDATIPGWRLALPRMHINDKMLLLLPSRLAYGEESQTKVPPNSVLIFDLELLDVFPRF